MSPFLLMIGLSVAFVAGFVVLLLSWVTVAERLSGLSRVRTDLQSKRLHERLTEVIIDELRPQADGAAGGLVLLGLAAVALLLGRAMHLKPGLEPLFLAVHVPALCFGVWGAMALKRKPLALEQSPLYRALFLAPASVQELSPTIVLLNIDVTGVGDALARQRVTQMNTPIPHVIVGFKDGTSHLVRGVHDKDFNSIETLAALERHLPGVPRGAPIPRTEPKPSSAPTSSGGLVARLAGIAVLTAVASLGALWWEDSGDQSRRMEAIAKVDAALAVAKSSSAPATAIQCPLQDVDAFDVSFVATRDPNVAWPNVRGETPFILGRTGASIASGFSRYAAAATVQGSGSTVNVGLVVVDVETKQVICAGNVSGPLDARTPSRSVDVVIAQALGLKSVL